MSKRKKSPVAPAVTGSLELQVGTTPSNSPVGTQRDLFGQEVAPVSPSARPASGKARPTKDTSGLNSDGSLPPVGHPSSSGSKSPAVTAESGLGDGRECSECQMLKPLSEFYRHKACMGGYRPDCKECCKAQERMRKANIPAEQKTAAFKQWRRTNRARALLTLAKHRAKQKGLEYSLDGCQECIQGVIDAGVCELTGIPFNLDGGKTWDSPSLDRIDSSQGYSLENVRVVLYCVNVMANIWGENKIVEIADAIMESRRNRSANLQGRLESALKAQIDTQSSPECEMIWKHSVMQSGAPICRLAARARPTSGKGSSGLQAYPTPQGMEPSGEARPSRAATGRTTEYLGRTAELAIYPTPDAQDFGSADNRWEERREEIKAQKVNGNGFGATLGMVASLAIHPSPRASDIGRVRSEEAIARAKERGGSTSLEDTAQLALHPTPNVPNGGRTGNTSNYREDGSKRQVDLAALSTLAIASGADSTSSTTATGKRGVLSPEHSRWLMGFPAAWGCCGAMAMLSCRRLQRNSSKRSCNQKPINETEKP